MTLRLLFGLWMMAMVIVACGGGGVTANVNAGDEVVSGTTTKGAKDAKEGVEMVIDKEDVKGGEGTTAKGAKDAKEGVKEVIDNADMKGSEITTAKGAEDAKKGANEVIDQEEVTGDEDAKKGVKEVDMEDVKEDGEEENVKGDNTANVPKDVKEEEKVVEAKPVEVVPVNNVPAVEPVPAPPFNHELWDQLLRKYVSDDGKVNYRGFKNDVARLNKYLVGLQDNAPTASWRRAEAMAYWLNVYNAFTIKLIVENYPVKSIQDIEGGKPWDKKWIKIGGKTYSLNEVENSIIRPTYKDARIHFAVNCAAKSCPTLYNRAFTPEKLERQLAQLTKTFVNNKSFNQIAKDKAQVSKIFDWYGEDFGDLKSFLNKYADVKIGDNGKIGFNEYDWGLNE